MGDEGSEVGEPSEADIEKLLLENMSEDEEEEGEGERKWAEDMGPAAKKRKT